MTEPHVYRRQLFTLTLELDKAIAWEYLTTQERHEVAYQLIQAAMSLADRVVRGDQGRRPPHGGPPYK
jgi:hypothetical protein